MRDFIEDYGDAIGGIIAVIIILSIAAAGMLFLADQQLVQSCHDIGMSYDGNVLHGQCVYHWEPGR